MDLDNNERLARVYVSSIQQLIIINDVAWKHMPGGDWFVRGYVNK